MNRVQRSTPTSKSPRPGSTPFRRSGKPYLTRIFGPWGAQIAPVLFTREAYPTCPFWNPKDKFFWSGWRFLSPPCAFILVVDFVVRESVELSGTATRIYPRPPSSQSRWTATSCIPYSHLLNAKVSYFTGAASLTTLFQGILEREREREWR